MAEEERGGPRASHVVRYLYGKNKDKAWRSAHPKLKFNAAKVYHPSDFLVKEHQLRVTKPLISLQTLYRGHSARNRLRLMVAKWRETLRQEEEQGHMQLEDYRPGPIDDEYVYELIDDFQATGEIPDVPIPQQITLAALTGPQITAITSQVVRKKGYLHIPVQHQNTLTDTQLDLTPTQEAARARRLRRREILKEKQELANHPVEYETFNVAGVQPLSIHSKEYKEQQKQFRKEERERRKAEEAMMIALEAEKEAVRVTKRATVLNNNLRTLNRLYSKRKTTYDRDIARIRAANYRGKGSRDQKRLDLGLTETEFDKYVADLLNEVTKNLRRANLPRGHPHIPIIVGKGVEHMTKAEYEEYMLHQ
jgi:hypothetical protein